LVRLCDNGKPAVTVYSDKTMIVCDEKRRAELIRQRERLLDGEAEVETAVPVALPAPETRSGANVGTENGIVARDQSPAPKQDPLSQWRESIRTAATWKPSEPEHHVGSFGPHPEEIY
jgi:hypothetical protein